MRPKIKQAKLANERLSNTVGGLEREKREREEKGGGIDERAEQGCEWLVVPLFAISETKTLTPAELPDVGSRTLRSCTRVCWVSRKLTLQDLLPLRS